MNARRRFMVAVSSLVLSAALLGGPTTAVAITITGCDGGTNIHGGSNKHSSVVLSGVQATLDKQVVPLCINPLPWMISSASWWVMITKGGASAFDYIQYGFWDCAVGCGFGWPCCDTGGEEHEFIERNNGNIGGAARFDLGWLPNGTYVMKIVHINDATPTFDFYRGGTLYYNVPDNGWRDWTLSSANFQLMSETWNLGDQNGGTAANPLLMVRAQWSQDHDPFVRVSMPDCYWTGVPQSQEDNYQCVRYTTTFANDSVKTWTLDR